eukprot:TRINITY_DN2935_c0_g1_i1.p1 TRINITY_DN2935_c0_g1~~TRINITY_DN2935_c0_g1_i1.p1  ORF type:complete len:320 (+),score=100.85 TRINITY_DN2935_c0_g1_i1:85-1044(+)
MYQTTSKSNHIVCVYSIGWSQSSADQIPVVCNDEIPFSGFEGVCSMDEGYFICRQFRDDCTSDYCKQDMFFIYKLNSDASVVEVAKGNSATNYPGFFNSFEEAIYYSDRCHPSYVRVFDEDLLIFDFIIPGKYIRVGKEVPRIAIKQVESARYHESLGEKMKVIIERLGDVNQDLSTNLLIQPAGFGGCSVSPSTVDFKSGVTTPVTAEITCPKSNDYIALGSLFSLALNDGDASTNDNENVMKISYIDVEDDKDDNDSTLLIVCLVITVFCVVLAVFVGKEILASPKDNSDDDKENDSSSIHSGPASNDVSKSFAAVV